MSTDSEEEVVVVIKRAEIDTRAPFRTVKEAVTLFGEKVFAGEVYANELKQMNKRAIENGQGPSRLTSVTAELEETKQSLQKAKEEGKLMATCLSSLQEELERTKRELRKLKEHEIEKQAVEPEILEDVDIVQASSSSTTTFEVKKLMSNVHVREGTELQKKRYVTFTEPPTPTQAAIPNLERHPSLRKKKKKPLIPLIGGIFSKKKGSKEVAALVP